MPDRIDMQPVTLDVVPVVLVTDKAREEGLAAANGRDLVQERVTQVVRLLAFVALLLFVVRALLGCAALDRAVPAFGVAHDAARVGCALLAASDGSSSEVLATTADMQRQILEAQADAAKQRGANRAEIEALQASVVALSAAVRANAEQILRASGDGPARLAPCPVAGEARP